MPTPGFGRAALDATVARMIAEYGEDSVKRSLARVTNDSNWKERIKKLHDKLYPAPLPCHKKSWREKLVPWWLIGKEKDEP